MAALPGIDGAGSSTLGGLDLAISSFGKHKTTATVFIKFLTSQDNERQNLEASSAAPVFGALYDDPALQAKFGYLTTLKAGLATAVPRPKVVDYGEATAVIQDDASAAIAGSKSVNDALSDMQAKLSAIIAAK